jgi:hypothetical protein
VLLGARPWEEAERPIAIGFTFHGAPEALHYRAHRFRSLRPSESDDDGLVDVDVTDYSRTRILDIMADDGTRVTIRMMITSYGGLAGPEVVSRPGIVIELPQCCESSDIQDLALNVLAFFEISLGQGSRMHGVTVRSVSEKDVLRALEESNFRERPDFEVRTATGEFDHSREVTHVAYVLFPVYEEEHRTATAAALKAWLDRRQQWRVAYDLASDYLGGPDIYGREKLLRLMAWFEAIPTYRGGSELSETALAKLRRAVRSLPEFESSGVTIQRLSQVLGELKRRPLKERLSEAVGRVREAFGEYAVPPETEADCHRAVDFRNDAAHGEGHEADRDFEEFFRAIEAVELVCCLSMLVDIPVLKERIGSRGHPLQSYRP